MRRLAIALIALAPVTALAQTTTPPPSPPPSSDPAPMPAPRSCRPAPQTPTS